MRLHPVVPIAVIAAMFAVLPTTASSAASILDAGQPEQAVTASPGAGPDRITGPIPQPDRPGAATHNYIFYATPFDLRRAGYVEQEFFISGTATRYPPNPTVDQQKQAAAPIGTMPYTTRIVVRRPAHPGRSAGIAVVDWQNVTA